MDSKFREELVSLKINYLKSITTVAFFFFYYIKFDYQEFYQQGVTRK